MSGAWRLDPARSSVEFHVRHFYGLMTVKGRFDEYQGTLDLNASPAVELIIEAASLDTRRGKRDEHLRGEEFFNAGVHPRVRFVSETDVVDGDRLTVNGSLHAAGNSIPLQVDATVSPAGEELEISATASADHRKLGMTWSPLGILRAPSALLVSGRLVREGVRRQAAASVSRVEKQVIGHETPALRMPRASRG